MEELPEFTQEKIKAITVSDAKNRLKVIIPLLELVKNRYIKYHNAMITFNEYVGDHINKISELRYNYEKAEEDLLDVYHKFSELDCVIKDPRTGLIDFIGIREGKPVWLCFKEGEIGLEFYHSMNGGFRGRKPIDFE